MNNFLQAAKEATKIASKVLLSYKGNISSDTIESKGMGDWVSEADRASEEAIIQYLSDRFPDHDILTEETGLIKSERRSKYRWIIDPLDGTTNFLRGLPIWAVSIGLEERSDSNSKWGEIIVGAIEIPMLKELFWASRNEGAFCNGKQIFGGKDKTTKDCLLATGFPFRTRHLISPYMELFSEIMQKFADVRRPGAVAADLCYLAAGIYDGFWELDL
nr:inositol monophosphatase [bacterium]